MAKVIPGYAYGAMKVAFDITRGILYAYGHWYF